MASIAALSSPNPQQIIDQINSQFQLDIHTLVNVTSAFLDEYHKGLSSYGHPMAMMSVLASLVDPITLL